MFDKYSHARVFATPKLVIDIYAGDMSMAKYYLKRYQDCIAICYDINTPKTLLIKLGIGDIVTCDNFYIVRFECQSGVRLVDG